jgi:hypothetical protein
MAFHGIMVTAGLPHRLHELRLLAGESGLFADGPLRREGEGSSRYRSFESLLNGDSDIWIASVRSFLVTSSMMYTQTNRLLQPGPEQFSGSTARILSVSLRGMGGMASPLRDLGKSVRQNEVPGIGDEEYVTRGGTFHGFDGLFQVEFSGFVPGSDGSYERLYVFDRLWDVEGDPILRSWSADDFDFIMTTMMCVPRIIFVV